MKIRLIQKKGKHLLAAFYSPTGFVDDFLRKHSRIFKAKYTQNVPTCMQYRQTVTSGLDEKYCTYFCK